MPCGLGAEDSIHLVGYAFEIRWVFPFPKAMQP